MKKYFLPFIALLFLLSGCSQSKSEEVSVNNPYEIAKGSTTLSYYDTEDNIGIDGFNILDLTPENVIGIQNQNENRIIIKDGIIRCIYIVDKDILTYNDISVGDSIDKIENNYEYEYKTGSCYNVVFNGIIEDDLTNQNKEDDWIGITYFTDGSKITSIQIHDVKYGREMQ